MEIPGIHTSVPEPGRGVLAYCSRGYLGMILCDEPEEVNYPDGTRGTAWTGVHMENGLEGRPWSSRNPRIPEQSGTYSLELENR